MQTPGATPAQSEQPSMFIPKVAFRSHCTIADQFRAHWELSVPVTPEGGIVAAKSLIAFALHGVAPNTTLNWHSDPAAEVAVVSIDPPFVAWTDIRILSCSATDAASPIIHLFAPSMSFTIPWSDVRELFTQEGSNLLISLTFVLSLFLHPPSGVSVPTICDPTALIAISRLLDTRQNHDVTFTFPGGKKLYADRCMLEKKSAYFRQFFRGSDEVDIDSKEGVLGGEDSDDDETATQPSEAATAATQDGDSDPPSQLLQKKRKLAEGAAFAQTDRYILPVSGISYTTFRAVLYYFYAEWITFAPLTSALKPLPDGRNPREESIRAYLRQNPGKPVPVSSKSVYAVASKYQLQALRALSLAHIESCLSTSNIITELFSSFCRNYPEPRKKMVEFVTRHWTDVKASPAWAAAKQEAREAGDAYFIDIMGQIMDVL
ncbi:hypothetical protein BOTBODRAFT_59994 [Botryobasidium botryosum FD-172 SS1]|uniref:BTB domain-containing protein n=1 Tax=Botryobasidium botryosum (strain FD-172 SS1) TaxID=930990 RepID=A0A067LVP0_BOTB1|nr:hypothetical protein BOTBODRAFT_59994 [Botryobasidium botryosum FD-172 SS1]